MVVGGEVVLALAGGRLSKGQSYPIPASVPQQHIAGPTLDVWVKTVSPEVEGLGVEPRLALRTRSTGAARPQAGGCTVGTDRGARKRPVAL